MARKHKFLSSLFVVIIFIFGLYSLKNSFDKFKTFNSEFKTEEQIKSTISNIELTYSDNFIFHDKFMNAYGLTQRLLNRYVIGNGDIYSDKQHKLHFYEESYDITSFINNASKLKEIIESIGIPFLYVATPSKTIDGYTELPDSININANTNLDLFVSAMHENSVNVLDLRNRIIEDKVSARNLFYATDHHWTNEAAFWAYCNIIGEINKLTNLSVDSENYYTNIGNYNIKIYKNRFLGSQGIRIGSWYVGKDDFSLIHPKFDTDYEYTHINGNNLDYYKGDFLNALMDVELLDGDMVNAYLANLRGGWSENIIINNKSINELKVLLIADSFGRAITPYLSTCFRETRYIDPQPGRFNDDIIKYINEYKPDVIVAMFNGECSWVEVNIGE